MTPHHLLDIVLHLKQSQLSAVQCVENALFENHLLQANLVAFKLIALKTFLDQENSPCCSPLKSIKITF